jgi:hypothetical protein
MCSLMTYAMQLPTLSIYFLQTISKFTKPLITINITIIISIKITSYILNNLY